ncbi:MAG: hypothetical protein K8I30_18250, partial [Anaerolineae bacterium]|nr:hypothetical protein [Anaerolineae bacterium]
NVSVYHADGTWVDDLQNEGNVDTMDWSPDGSTLAGGNSIWFWNGKAFERQGSISTGRVAALDWSPDGSTIATAASNFNQVRLWDTTGKPLANLNGHMGNVQALRWSPDSTQLASGAADGTIRLWSVGELGNAKTE